MIISLGAGVATLAGTALLLDSGYADWMNEYISEAGRAIFGEINPVYDSMRDMFLTCVAPAGVVSGLTELVLDISD